MTVNTRELINTATPKEQLIRIGPTVKEAVSRYEEFLFGGTDIRGGRSYGWQATAQDNFPDWIFRPAHETYSQRALNRVRQGRYLDSGLLGPLDLDSKLEAYRFRVFLGAYKQGRTQERIGFTLVEIDGKVATQEQLANLRIDEEWQQHFRLSEVTPEGRRYLEPIRQTP